MSNADTFIYEDSIENEVIEKPFISKEVQVVYDSNNGIYNNQILFSTNNLTNTGKWVDFQNSYIEIPFTMAMNSSVAFSAGAANPFMMGIKDGSIQLVDSIILQYNGTSMVQQSILTNAMQHFKILSCWTYEDLLKWGPPTSLYPDETTSMHFSNVANPFGDGVSNNQVSGYAPTAANAQPLWNKSFNSFNTGFLKRMQYGALNTTAGNAAGSNGLRQMSQAQANIVGRSNFTPGANTCYWQVLLTLRLKDLSDFFNKIPILKAARIDLTINFNSFSNTIAYVSGTGVADGTMITTASNQLAGHSCPYMVAAASILSGPASTFAQPNAILSAGGNLTVGSGINGVNGVPAIGANTSPIFNNCRWFVPLYECNPVYEQNLLASNPLKTIYYDDFYTYSSISAQSGSFSALITSGVKNPKYLVLFPFFSPPAALSGNATSVSPYQSCFDSAPATASPTTLTNLQVQVGGKTLFPLIEQYNFQQFIDEFSAIFAINGGKSSIMTSGMITQTMWENAPVYVADLSRRLPQDDDSPKSIQISATVSSLNQVSAFGGGNATATIDIVAFVVYQRSATFNLLNGLLESST